ncbi:MAG: DUF4337 domain-containing protein [Selenomonadaceae bacterium]
MAEEKKDAEKKDEGKKWSERTTQLVALTALLLAICATFSTLKAGGFTNAGILAQNQASDMWAFYQAKSLKENIYKTQIQEITLNQRNLDSEAAEKTIEKYQQKVDEYKDEEKDISEKAKALEAKRDRSLELRTGFSQGLTYLQIAILLSSLAALIKLIYFWYASLAIGAVGVFYFVSTLMVM